MPLYFRTMIKYLFIWLISKKTSDLTYPSKWWTEHQVKRLVIWFSVRLPRVYIQIGNVINKKKSKKCVEIDYGIRLPKKMFVSECGGGDNTSSPFYGLSILTSNFASRSSVRSVLSLFSPIDRFLPVFISEPTFMQQKFAYDVGLVSTYFAHNYSTFSWPSTTSNLR